VIGDYSFNQSPKPTEVTTDWNAKTYGRRGELNISGA